MLAISRASSTSIAAAHEPDAWDDVTELPPVCDLLNQPEHDVELDQRISW